MVTYDELFGFVTMLCTVITLVIYALRKKYRPSVTSTGAEFQKILSRPGGHGKYLPTHEIFFHKPPTTIREYKRSAKTDLQELMSIKICDLTQETVQQDAAEAARWYQKGAEAGDVRSMSQYASCCESGLGTRRDLQRAIHWYRMAARQGDDGAERCLARLEEKGRK